MKPIYLILFTFNSYILTSENRYTSTNLNTTEFALQLTRIALNNPDQYEAFLNAIGYQEALPSNFNTLMNNIKLIFFNKSYTPDLDIFNKLLQHRSNISNQLRMPTNYYESMYNNCFNNLANVVNLLDQIEYFEYKKQIIENLNLMHQHILKLDYLAASNILKEFENTFSQGTRASRVISKMFEQLYVNLSDLGLEIQSLSNILQSNLQDNEIYGPLVLIKIEKALIDEENWNNTNQAMAIKRAREIQDLDFDSYLKNAILKVTSDISRTKRQARKNLQEDDNDLLFDTELIELAVKNFNNQKALIRIQMD